MMVLRNKVKSYSDLVQNTRNLQKKIVLNFDSIEQLFSKWICISHINHNTTDTKMSQAIKRFNLIRAINMCGIKNQTVVFNENDLHLIHIFHLTKHQWVVMYAAKFNGFCFCLVHSMHTFQVNSKQNHDFNERGKKTKLVGTKHTKTMNFILITILVLDFCFC